MIDDMEPLETVRLTLVPATASIVRDELECPQQFVRRIDVAPVADWPPPDLRDALPIILHALERAPESAGWHAWYWITRHDRTLVGGGGFKRPPDADGSVEIGYFTRPPFRRAGYAREAMSALVAWALRVEDVVRVIAETHSANAASRVLLRTLGFSRCERAHRNQGMLRYERGLTSRPQ